MSEYKPLDATADVLPVGLHPTPFGEVWQALQQVAAQVWDVDPSVYRAGIAWMWYALRNPAALDADGLRPLLVAALISEQAPLVKDTQTAAELAEYLRLWRDYTPTYPKLEALYGVFAADVKILPITAPGYAPPSNTRLAFFVVIRGIDFDRPLTADEASLIAVRATPLGSHPVVVTELSEDFSLPVYPMRAGVPAISVENDAICEPVTPPTPAYTEITLYLASGNKQAQSGVTSSFTGNVNSSYCYPLYTDAECTVPFVYDYSNDYELGRYVDGVWTPYTRQSVTNMPASTTGNYDYVFGRILLDTGELWHVTNYQFTGTTSNLNPIIRIYPKEQQHYIGYLAYNNAYSNTTITTATKGFYPKPTNGSQANTSGWFSTFPKATIARLLMSAGNDAQSASGDKIAASTNYKMIFRQSSAVSRTFRAIEYTLDRPTLHAWLKTDHTNKSTASAGLNLLYDDAGNQLMFDGDYSVVYVPIGLFVSTGANCANNMATLERAKFGRTSANDFVFIQNYATVSIARVWYVKYTDCKVAYFNANKSGYTWTQGTTRVLFDENGEQIPYDSTKTYTIIQLRDASRVPITPTFGDLALKSLINNAGLLACNAASGGTYSSLTVASVWYLEESLPEIDLDVNFGDPVTIPAGYHVESVKCSRGYAFASNVSSEPSIMGQFVHYELPGENVYFDETNTALVGVGVAPALQIVALLDLNNSSTYVSTKSGTQVSYLASASASYLNSDGYFVKGSTTYNDSDVMNRVASGMQTFPVYFNLADSSGNWLYFCFRVPQTLWRFQNGVFSWLGDTTDSSDLAYWYNGRAVQIILARDE